MNFGIVIGTISLLIGMTALGAALCLRSVQASGKPARQNVLWFAYRFGLVLLLFVTAVTAWDAFQSRDWSKGLQSAGFLAMSLSALVVAQQATPSRKPTE